MPKWKKAGIVWSHEFHNYEQNTATGQKEVQIPSSIIFKKFKMIFHNFDLKLIFKQNTLFIATRGRADSNFNRPPAYNQPRLQVLQFCIIFSIPPTLNLSIKFSSTYENNKRLTNASSAYY